VGIEVSGGAILNPKLTVVRRVGKPSLIDERLFWQFRIAELVKQLDDATEALREAQRHYRELTERKSS
jgi:hypothetical protein